jgi:hypothetical protein
MFVHLGPTEDAMMNGVFRVVGEGRLIMEAMINTSQQLRKTE